MELKEFIQQTIIQITDGILEGNKYIKGNDFGQGVSDETANEIDFDIAVSSTEDKSSGVSGKISVASIFSAGGKAENAIRAATVSRIQFKIAVFIKTQ